MKPYSLYVFDLDGTLFRGNQPLPYAIQVLDELRKQGKQIRLLTNNSSYTRLQIAQRLHSMGFACQESEAYGTAYGASLECKARGYQSAYVIGENGLRDSLLAVGVQIFEKEEPQADVVVAGIDFSFTYAKLDGAMQHLLKGSAFIATNPDPVYPIEGGHFRPGAGSILAALRTCSGKEALIIGKPHPTMVELILKDAGITRSEVLIVGDQLETDIACAKAVGCDSLLVLTGVTSKAPPGQWAAPDLRVLLSAD